MEALVLPAEDQFACQHDAKNQRLVCVGCYYTNRHEGQRNNSLAQRKSLHTYTSCKILGPPNVLISLPGHIFEHETDCLSPPVSPNTQPQLKHGLLASPVRLTSFPSPAGFDEGLATPPGRRWHSMPSSGSLAGQNNFSSIEAQDHVAGIHSDHSRSRQVKNDIGRISRSNNKNKRSGHLGLKIHRDLNDKRTLCDWKPAEIGAQNGKSVPIIARSRIPERMGIDAISEASITNEACAFSPSTSVTENWAGPAYSNSPPPSSLPFPKFSMRQMRSVSLELPSSNNEFTETVATIASLPGSSQSAPSSPSRGSPFMLQDPYVDVALATKDLRRMLNLDFNA